MKEGELQRLSNALSSQTSRNSELEARLTQGVWLHQDWTHVTLNERLAVQLALRSCWHVSWAAVKLAGKPMTLNDSYTLNQIVDVDHAKIFMTCRRCPNAGAV